MKTPSYLLLFSMICFRCTSVNMIKYDQSTYDELNGELDSEHVTIIKTNQEVIKGYDIRVSQDSTTESWYIYLGLGYANVSYPSEIQDIIDQLKKQEGVSNTPLSIDLGSYWHLTPNTIGGVIINGVADRFVIDRIGEDKNHMQFSHYLIGASVMHYPGQAFVSGLFIRGDVGIAKIIISSSFSNSSRSEICLGLLAGGGWSFDLGGTRLLLNVNYAYRGVEGEAYNTLAFSIGGLF